MPNIKFTNFARSKVATGINSSATTLAITGGTGALFPALTGAEYFYLTLENSSLVREIVKVTARTADTLTIVRAQDGTTAVAWVAGDVVSLRFNAAAISEAVTGTLLAANNLSDVANAATARANIGAVASGDYIGAATAATQTAGDNSTKVATTAYVATAVGGVTAPQIQPISASVGSNALTITLNPCALSFRSTTLSSGAVTAVNLAAAISLTISSGSTLGTVNAQQSRIVVLAINNAGTIELAAVNIAGGNDLSETGLITTTAEGGAGGADTSNVIYSATARTSVPYRVVGYVESTQATAGTWATAPSTIQGAGGQALAAMSSLGYGQTWQNVTGSRAASTVYYNTTGRPITVMLHYGSIGQSAVATVGTMPALTYSYGNTGQVGQGVITMIVPAGVSYSASAFTDWLELR